VAFVQLNCRSKNKKSSSSDFFSSGCDLNDILAKESFEFTSKGQSLSAEFLGNAVIIGVSHVSRKAHTTRSAATVLLTCLCVDSVVSISTSDVRAFSRTWLPHFEQRALGFGAVLWGDASSLVSHQSLVAHAAAHAATSSAQLLLLTGLLAIDAIALTVRLVRWAFGVLLDAGGNVGALGQHLDLRFHAGAEFALHNALLSGVTASRETRIFSRNALQLRRARCGRAVVDDLCAEGVEGTVERGACIFCQCQTYC
ncbi:hypothetical protein PFISCL1PPCAC_829, partial [Pristionchus fissidentatus]